MDIYALIRKDHEDIKRMIDQIQKIPVERHAERLRHFYVLKESLLAHNEAEEESFYVALEQHAKTRDDAHYSEKEHHEADYILERLDDKSLGPVAWGVKFTRLCDAVLKHIDKEEGHIFTEAKDVLTPDIAQQL
ncbi:MAG: hemerythrin domain-containing protein, partial [Alphaproteobacteria bacterium]